MNKFHPVLVSILLLLMNACVDNSEVIPSKDAIVNDDVNTHVNFGFNPEHPNAEQFNWMLNEYEEEIVAVEIDWDLWENEELIQERFAFTTSETALMLYLVFCHHQNDCISICETNFEPTTDSLVWGVNGGVAFIVSGDNLDNIYNLASYLAGEE